MQVTASPPPSPTPAPLAHKDTLGFRRSAMQGLFPRAALHASLITHMVDTRSALQLMPHQVPSHGWVPTQVAISGTKSPFVKILAFHASSVAAAQGPERSVSASCTGASYSRGCVSERRKVLVAL